MRSSASCNCVCYFLSLVGLGFLCVAVVNIFIFETLLTDGSTRRGLPLAINTWPFTNATATAWDAVYRQNLSAIDAVELGCSVCEREQCDFTVGYGGSPDEDGETTLDAFIMDGVTMNIGAVGALRGIKSAISVARRVLENTRHSILVGELATQFALQMGFHKENLTTAQSQQMWKNWQSNRCQPNYWTDVEPDPSQQCGPYHPLPSVKTITNDQIKYSHDTISMVALDRQGRVAVGTSSNGANHKIPGRVGDAPLVGAGGYADGTVGAAACTGDGDVMMRFLPSFLAVEEMRHGSSPEEAAKIAISRIAKYYPTFSGAIITVNIQGDYAASCHGLDSFPYSVHNPQYPSGVVLRTSCI
uniref:N(4)-(beta-N-acetylglucosaminyl)-L-asparaginase n=1 Tax=Cuerna arida TaxID=1464854 RepID=A0A1B6G619_9HEMI